MMYVSLVLPEIVHYKYVIVGGGTTAVGAVLGIREVDKEGSILVIGEEEKMYSRTALSKSLWVLEEGEALEKKKAAIVYPLELYNSAEFWSSKKVEGINVAEKRVDLADRKVYFDKLLIATGSRPKTLEGVSQEALPHVSTFRSFEDFVKLRKVAEKSRKILVVGGSFLGTELTSSLNQFSRTLTGSSLEVVQVFKEEAPLASHFPDYLSHYLMKVGESRGVSFLPNRFVKRVEKEGERVKAVFENGEEMECDHVVVAIGVLPNSEITFGNAIELDANNAISTNAELQVRSNVWAAGEVASGYTLEGRRWFKHHNDAIETGNLAGMNMAGAGEPIMYFTFYSGLAFGTRYDVVGKIGADLNSFGVWSKSEEEIQHESVVQEEKEDSSVSQEALHQEKLKSLDPKDLQMSKERQLKQGIVYFTNKKKRLVGILLWDLADKNDKAMDALMDGPIINDILEASTIVSIINPQDKYKN